MSWQTTPANKPVDLFAGMIAYDKPGTAQRPEMSKAAASSHVMSMLLLFMITSRMQSSAASHGMHADLEENIQQQCGY